jgi:hypothetical protein
MNAPTFLRLLAAASLSLTALHAKSPDTKAAAKAIDEISAKDWAISSRVTP